MSISTLYRMFFALTGFTIMQYIRLRRINNAVYDIKSSDASLLDIALDYGFGSHSSFTKAVKKHTGYNPNEYRHNSKKFNFERINIMEKYVDVKEIINQDEYPGIKVLKTLKPMRVAYYCYEGLNPEHKAFKIISEWFMKSNLDIEKHKIRIFGFNNPSPTKPDQIEYGYEVMITIPDDFNVEDENVKVKQFNGGKYAVFGVPNLNLPGDGKEIMEAWQKLNAWIKNSKYNYGVHQWLEEHTGFNEEFTHFKSMDLYMPIQQKI